MAKPKTEKTKAQIALETARAHLASAKEKNTKNPNAENAKRVQEASAKVHEAATVVNRERFLAVGSVRMGKALAALSNLARVANKRSYEFSEKEVDKMTGDLKAAADHAISEFRNALKTPEKGAKTATAGYSFE